MEQQDKAISKADARREITQRASITSLAVKTSMKSWNWCSLHPEDPLLPIEFYYGNMKVERKWLSTNPRPANRMQAIFESYLKAGIFPSDTRLLGDYLEHRLIRDNGSKGELAGRFIGIVFPGGDYQYVRLEGESIGVVKQSLEPPSRIDILTDTCLFCASNATATLENGDVVSIVAPTTRISSPVKDLCILDHLCIYEVDAVIRLTDLISSMMRVNSAYHTAVIAIPTVEYYLYLLDAYNNGFVEKDKMLRWLDEVNRHAEMLTAAFQKRISLHIETCQPLEAVRGYIERCVISGERASFDEVLRRLSTNELWRDVLAVTHPKEWKALNYVNYAVSVLESGMSSGVANKLLIDIENPSEQRVLRNSAKIADKLGKTGKWRSFRVIGVYPHEKVFASPDHECSGSFPRLYYLEQDMVETECYYREIIRANRTKVSA